MNCVFDELGQHYRLLLQRGAATWPLGLKATAWKAKSMEQAAAIQLRKTDFTRRGGKTGWVNWNRPRNVSALHLFRGFFPQQVDTDISSRPLLAPGGTVWVTSAMHCVHEVCVSKAAGARYLYAANTHYGKYSTISKVAHRNIPLRSDSIRWAA